METHWELAHIIFHPHNWIFVTGAKVGLHIRIS